MVLINTSDLARTCKPSPHAELRERLDAIDATALLSRLKQYRPRQGRPGFPNEVMWRAYAATYFLNLPHTNALIRLLREDPLLRELCGFGDNLPHRTTFNRFIRRLGYHSSLVEQVITGGAEEMNERLPGFGKVVAVDSTAVRSHSNGYRNKGASDQEASWTAKTSARSKDGAEWSWGFKTHMVADATYGIPLAVNVTTGSRSDNPELPPLIEKAQAMYSWFKPEAVIADRGYDGRPNVYYLSGKGIKPVIPRRRTTAERGLYGGIYTKEGVPTCLGNVAMEFVRSDPKRGRLYRCRSEGCHLKDKTTGSTHCDIEVWEDPKAEPWLVGIVRRGSPEWDELYSKRQSIERIFKSMKESRRLERHCVRGLRQIRLHALMSTLAYQTTILVALRRGEAATMRWMVKAVA